MSRDRGSVFAQGLGAGLIGYGAVVLFFGVTDALAGRSLVHTPAALGSALFFSGAGASGEAAPVIAYNGVHMILSVGVGLLAAWLVQEVEEHHQLWYVLFFLLTALFMGGILFFGVVGAELGGVLGWGSAILGNLAWAVPVTAFLLRIHRGLVRDLESDPMLETGA